MNVDQNPYATPERRFAPETKPKGSNGLGIASLIISILSGVGMLTAVVAAGFMAASNPTQSEGSVVFVAIGLAIIGMFFVSLLALILGILGLVFRNRTKVYSILGIVFSAMTILGTAALMIIGMVAR